MAALDVNQLFTDITTAATAVVNQDIATVQGFSERQVQAISQQAALVSSGIVSGQITDATREFFLDSLEHMIQNFLATLRGLLTIALEKLWNAVVGVVWNAINGAISAATGLVLPVPVKA